MPTKYGLLREFSGTQPSPPEGRGVPQPVLHQRASHRAFYFARSRNSIVCYTLPMNLQKGVRRMPTFADKARDFAEGLAERIFRRDPSPLLVRLLLLVACLAFAIPLVKLLVGVLLMGRPDPDWLLWLAVGGVFLLMWLSYVAYQGRHTALSALLYLASVSLGFLSVVLSITGALA